MACLTKQQKKNIALNFISRYAIYINGKRIKTNIIGWKTAIAIARKQSNDLFEPNKVVEIVNIWTAEIVTLKEAEERARSYRARLIKNSRQ